MKLNRFSLVGLTFVIYATIRLILFIWKGGQSALIYVPFILLNIFLFLLLLLLFIGIYFFIRKYIRNKLIVGIIMFFVANILAYLTMEDFHKFFRLTPYSYSMEERNILESLKMTYYEGFNYIGWMCGVLFFLFYDLRKNIFYSF